MTHITLHPGDKPVHDQPRYFIWTRVGTHAPWNTHINAFQTDRDAAVRTAQAKAQREPHLLVRVVDENGIPVWTNES